GDGIHKLFRNNVVLKWISYQPALRITGRDARGGGVVNGSLKHRTAERVVAEAPGGQGAPEIAVAVFLYRNGIRDRVDNLVIAILLEIEKEECLVVAVIQLAQIDRAAQREAVVMPAYARPRIVADPGSRGVQRLID